MITLHFNVSQWTSTTHKDTVSKMNCIVDIIKKKRDGEELTNDEISYFVKCVTDGSMEECQIGAMLMAIYIQKLTENETFSLTSSMVRSGSVLEWNPAWNDLLVDKHSTGGAGDKVSLPLAPALAALGFKVPMVSGRGLEFTGGTLDKLESIPGFKVQCSIEEMKTCLDEVGCFIAGATDDLAPADKVLYKYRDVTATVANNSLTVGSIVSKKVAEGIKMLVMDIKVGRAAFFKAVDNARVFAHQLIKISGKLGIKAKAILSRMDVPIGRTIGNSLEVAEAIECLRGRGTSDLLELVSTLGAVILQTKGKAASLEKGKEQIIQTIVTGKALSTFRKMLTYQGVSEDVSEKLCHGDVWEILPKVPESQVTPIRSMEKGVVLDIDAMKVAVVSWKLGSGRSRAGNEINYCVGIKILKAVGEEVNAGDVILEAHHGTEELDPQLENELTEAIKVGPPGITVEKISPVIEIL